MKKHNDLDVYIEYVVSNYEESFFEEKGYNDFEDSELENKWLKKLYEKDIAPDYASEIIQRAFYLYVYQENNDVNICGECDKECDKQYCSEECFKMNQI